jgi:hypothetical protein
MIRKRALRHFDRALQLPLGDIVQSASLVLLAFSVILAVISIRKFRDSRGIDLILQAESAADPLHHGLVGADPALIRSIYRNYGVDALSDDDCRALSSDAWAGHISRQPVINWSKQSIMVG